MNGKKLGGADENSKKNTIKDHPIIYKIGKLETLKNLRRCCIVPHVRNQ